MLQINFSIYYLVCSFCLIISQLWYFFIKNNFFIFRLKPFFFDKLYSQNTLKKINYKVLLRYFIVLNGIFLINFFFYKGVETLMFWNHLVCTNFNFYLFYYLYLFYCLIILIIYAYSRTTLVISIEYFFAICNINIISLLLFMSNNLYSLFFLLELITVFIFYKFTVSKFWFNYKLNKLTSWTSFSTKIFSFYFINMLFFQYWSAFFSSILILYSLITTTLFYGSSDWFLLNFFFKINTNIIYFEKKEFYLIYFPLFIGLIIKLGLTPVHLYKIEIYKGLPFISIFLYTTYFFLIYFIFFVFFFLYFLISYTIITSFFLFLILFVGGCYFISILFDGILMKSFFAFSTIINSLNFILILLSGY